MKYTVRVTQEILDRKLPYADTKNCSIAAALREAGIAVTSVGGFTFIYNGKRYNLPRRFTQAPERDGYNITGFSRPFEFEVNI